MLIFLTLLACDRDTEKWAAWGSECVVDEDCDHGFTCVSDVDVKSEMRCEARCESDRDCLCGCLDNGYCGRPCL